MRAYRWCEGTDGARGSTYKSGLILAHLPSVYSTTAEPTITHEHPSRQGFCLVVQYSSKFSSTVNPYVVPFYYIRNDKMRYFADFPSQAVKDEFLKFLRTHKAVQTSDWYRLDSDTAVHDNFAKAAQLGGNADNLSPHARA